MDKHFRMKCAFRDSKPPHAFVRVGPWSTVPGQTRLVRQTSGPVLPEPPPEAIFAMYHDPRDESWFTLRGFDGRAIMRTADIGTHKSMGPTGTPHTGTGVQLRFDAGNTFLLMTINGVDFSSGGHSSLGGNCWTLATPEDGVAPFHLDVVTPPWQDGWGGADLTGVDFRAMGAVLPRVRDWNDADMTGAIFDKLDLRQVKFDDRAKLAGASLREVNFAGYDFRYANLDGADFTKANLAGSTFANASMVATNFAGADLTNARFGAAPKFSTETTRRTSLTGAKLAGAQLTTWAYLNLRGTTMSVTPAEDVDARHADLRGGTVAGARLRRATLDDALLEEADLAEAEAEGASFDRCDLRTTRLPRSPLDDCSFVKADLSGQQLTAASMKRSDLTDAKLVDTSLDEADLTGATLDKADLTSAVLVSTDLTDASLREVILRGASMTSARLVRADCTKAQIGATKLLFSVPITAAAVLSDSAVDDVVRDAFATHGPALTRSGTLTAAGSRRWLLTDDDQRYRVTIDERAERIDVHAYLSTDQAAVLTAVYMPDAVFDEGEMFAVNMSRAHWYGSRASATGANLEQIDVSGANLGQIDLSGAQLMGARCNAAILAAATLRGADLGPSTQGETASLHQAHLGGADLTAAKLHDAVTTDAAVAIEASADDVTIVGVPLFMLDRSHADTLDDTNLSEPLLDAFIHNGYRLASDARVTQLSAGSAWEITQGHDDPQQTTNRYASFKIIRRDDALHVHGSVLWITRIGDDGSLDTIRFEYAETRLTEHEMNKDTTCPNGKKLSTNQAEQRAWHEIMTALNRPPTPPECIPDPDDWGCPPPT